MNNTTAEKDIDKANMLNTFLRKCWYQAEPPLSESQYMKNSYDNWYEDANVSPEEVLQLIKGLDIKKVSGSDEVSAYMLRTTAECIAPSLFSLSLSSGNFLYMEGSLCSSYPQIWQ